MKILRLVIKTEPSVLTRVVPLPHPALGLQIVHDFGYEARGFFASISTMPFSAK